MGVLTYDYKSLSVSLLSDCVLVFFIEVCVVLELVGGLLDSESRELYLHNTFRSD